MAFFSRLLRRKRHEVQLPRDFYYIDEQLLRMYFTQLPESDQATFRGRAFAGAPSFEIGLSPKLALERYRPELPYDKKVALALFMEREIRKQYTVSPLLNIRSKFCGGSFDALHAALVFPSALPIFLAYPDEGISEQLRRQRRSFLILGEGSFCSRAWQFEPDHPLGESVFSRLLDLFQNVVTEKTKDVADAGQPAPFHSRPDAQDDYLDKVLYLVETEYRPKLRQDIFRGVFVVRQQLQTQRGSLSVLYPLFLERPSLPLEGDRSGA